MEKLVLIDGNSLLNRAFYATPVFTTQNGIPTNAIFGFIKLLFKICDDLNPEYLIVAFDLKAATFRHNMYSEYKANRKPMPEELAAQVEPLKLLLAKMGVAMCSKEGYEADDILGTLSNKFNVHSYIYTGDRDSYQLVDEKTDVYYTKRGVTDLLKLNINNFKQTLGINPPQVIDLKALMGDKSDNIPGVPGIGEKTALDLINKYQTLDGIYEHLEEIKGATKDKLVKNKSLAELSYKLASIDRNCELEININNCVAPKKFGVEVKKAFSELEFKSFLSMDIYEEESENVLLEELPEKILDADIDELKCLILKHRKISIELTTDRLNLFVGGKEYELTLNDSLLGDGLNYLNLIELLAAIFSDINNTVVAYDYKKLLHTLKDYGVECKCDFNDLSILTYLTDYVATNLTLSDLLEYNSLSKNYPAYGINCLFAKYYASLSNDKIIDLYEKIEKPLLYVLFEMECEGVRVSESQLNELSIKISQKLDELNTIIYEQAGVEFNINSPSQLGEVLFDRLGLKHGKKNKNGKYSTNAEILEKLAEENKIVADVLKYRQYQKLYSTYIEGIRPLINKNSGLIHTTFNQTVAATGRLSSTNPNLQNIPIREEEGREIRKMFIPKKGNVFIDADYSQIELRLLAHFSGCKELIDAYNSNVDIHAVTASQVFGVPLNEITPKMRREAKAVNFGIIYGISEYGLSKNLNISVKVAKEYIEKYFQTYSAVKDYMNYNVEYAKENGYVSTLTGRKRVIFELKSTKYMTRSFGERAAMNMPLQGSSADIIKIAMVNVHNALKEAKLNAKLILQVHDELILDCPEEETELATEILKREMENAVSLKVPLTVDVHVGKNWYDAK